jgi:hypothetical protein
MSSLISDLTFAALRKSRVRAQIFFQTESHTQKISTRKKTLRDSLSLTKPLLRPSLAHHKFFPPAKSFISSFITHYPSPWQTTQIMNTISPPPLRVRP